MSVASTPQTGDRSPRALPRWAVPAAGGAIVVAALAAYRNSLSGPFVFLDVPAIVDNRSIRHLWPIWPVLSPPSDGGITVGGRPMVNLSLALNYAAGGLGVRGYHAVNLAIHVLASLALFGIVRRTFVRLRLGSPCLLAFAAALLWAVHPLQTESVTYLIQRAESLMGLFYLLTVYCFVRGVEASEGAHRGLWFWLCFLACLLGMATKEVMVSAPVMIFLYDRTFICGNFRDAWRLRWRLYGALAGSWLLVAGLLVSTGGNRGGTAGFGGSFDWWRYILTQFPAITRYLRLALWPDSLDFYSGAQWVEQPARILPEFAVVMLLVVAAAALFFRPIDSDGSDSFARGDGKPGFRALGFCGLWFFAILAPTSLVPGLSQTMAEHRMYLALAPVVVIGVLGIFRAGRWTAKKVVPLAEPSRLGLLAAVLGLLPCILLGAELISLTARRNEVYRSELVLWTDTAMKSPDDPYVHNNLGVALIAADRPREAAAHFIRALELRPGYAEAHDNLGLVQAQMGQLTSAISHYEQALGLMPQYAEAEANLGMALANSGRVPEALFHLQRAVQLKPDYADAQNNLAVVLAASGRPAEAIAGYEKVLRLTPDRTETHYNLGNAFVATGQSAAAIVQYREAVRLKPDYVEALSNLGAMLAQAGQWTEAIEDYQRALKVAPADPDIHYNLGLALKAVGRTQESESELAEAARLLADIRFVKPQISSGPGAAPGPFR